MSASSAAKTGANQDGVQPDSQRGERRQVRGGAGLGTGRRRYDLVEQTDLAVGGGAEAAQVTRLETELGQLPHEGGDHQVVRLVVALVRATSDQLELLDLLQGLLVDAGRVQQLLAAHPGEIGRASCRERVPSTAVDSS